LAGSFGSAVAWSSEWILRFLVIYNDLWINRSQWMESKNFSKIAIFNIALKCAQKIDTCFLFEFRLGAVGVL
jgi:hypothetical protein